MKLWVWAEYFTPEQAIEENVISLLKKYDVTLSIATQSHHIDDNFARMLDLYHQNNIDVSPWLLLPDEKGYWPNKTNVDDFGTMIRDLFDWTERKGLHLPWLSIDLEPSVEFADVLSGGSKFLSRSKLAIEFYRRARKGRKDFTEASKKYQQLLDDIHGHQCKALAIAFFFHIDDIRKKREKFQAFFGLPVTTVQWDRVSLMIYNSMMVPMLKGLYNFKDAATFLYHYAKIGKEYFGQRMHTSIGVTWVGKIGNEPYYKKPEEMKMDVEAVRGAGVEEIAIYNLEGILRCPKPEEWFELILKTEPKTFPTNFKLRLLMSAISATYPFI